MSIKEVKIEFCDEDELAETLITLSKDAWEIVSVCLDPVSDFDSFYKVIAVRYHGQ